MWSAQAVMIILALICWGLAAVGRPVPPQYGIGWLGMVFFGLSFLIR
jgi:hypothetical protein